MFRVLICPSSVARDYDVDYHISRIVLGLLHVGRKVQLGWSSVRVAGLKVASSWFFILQLGYIICQGCLVRGTSKQM